MTSNSNVTSLPNHENPKKLATESADSRLLSGHLFEALEPEGSIDWDGDGWRGNRRPTELLPRAIFSIVHSEKLLEKIQADRERSSKHQKVIGALRKYATGSQFDLEQHPDWLLWTISSLIRDAQHQIAATLDRCTNFWILELGLGGPGAGGQTRTDRQDLENHFLTYPGSRLTILELFVRFLKNAVDSIGDQNNSAIPVLAEQSERALSFLSEICHVFSTGYFVDTNNAAHLIEFARKRCENTAKVNHGSGAVTAGRLLFNLEIDKKLCTSEARFSGNKNEMHLSKAECLAIVIGRVNDFKHRATPPAHPDERHSSSIWNQDGPYQRNIELALTAQALLSVIEYYKVMTAYLKSVALIRETEVLIRARSTPA